MSEPLTAGAKKQEPQVPEEVHERFVAGVQLAQRWGAGFGERAPGGAQFNPVTGERIEPEKPNEEKPDEPEKKDEETPEAAAPEAAEATEEKPDEESKNDLTQALERISNYVQRQQRAVAAE